MATKTVLGLALVWPSTMLGGWLGICATGWLFAQGEELLAQAALLFTTAYLTVGCAAVAALALQSHLGRNTDDDDADVKPGRRTP